ncbi:MAG: hypothetical protein ACT4UQ_04025 [Gammaproteobacteria bacterium]
MLSRTLLILAFLSMTACTKHWDLEVTEVGNNEIELYMNIPVGEPFSLRGMSLSWAAHGGRGGTIDLGVMTDPLLGGEYLVVWERGGYSGPPVVERFVSGVMPAKGIKVAAGFFDGLDAAPGMVQVKGFRSAAIVVRHEVLDGVRFGLPTANRPPIDALFTDDGTMTLPTGSQSVQRRFSGSTPTDTDSESDWKQFINSFGTPTP